MWGKLSASRLVEELQGAFTAIRQQLLAVTRQSERTLLLGTILLASTISAATGFVLIQYYSVDVLSSLIYVPEDCWLDWGTNIGRHCFSDYSFPANATLLPNPWTHLLPPGWPDNAYPAAAMVPLRIFARFGAWLGAPRLGLLGYLFALTIAVLSPALWAARGVRGLERIVVFVACGAVAIPAWMVVDRGNSTGLVVPIALGFLVALCQQRFGRVTIMVVLAALVKPQFALLAVALLAARQWRLGGIAVVGVVTSNLAAYLLWPRDFPGTIAQSIHNALGYGFFKELISPENVSFGKGLLLIADGIEARGAGGKIPVGFLAGPRSLIGYGVLVLVVVAVMALGRRVPPVMVGIVLLATVSLFPALVYRYYLVFALPIAALVLRDPDGPPGSGIFDRFGDRRRIVRVCVSLATALSIAYVALPGMPYELVIAGQPGVLKVVHTTQVVATTVILTPLLWLIACAVIIVSYTRRPAPRAWVDVPTTSVSGEGETKQTPTSQSAAAVNTNAMSPAFTSVATPAAENLRPAPNSRRTPS
jgi:hypothetical protein